MAIVERPKPIAQADSNMDLPNDSNFDQKSDSSTSKSSKSSKTKNKGGAKLFRIPPFTKIQPVESQSNLRSRLASTNNDVIKPKYLQNKNR